MRKKDRKTAFRATPASVFTFLDVERFSELAAWNVFYERCAVSHAGQGFLLFKHF